MTLRSYHPDLPVIRANYAKYAAAVEHMDTRVGETIAALKEDGLYEDTIVIYNSDHGGVMARSKRFVYSSGIHCPLIVRIPKKWKAWYPADAPGTTVDRIVSFVDMPKTWCSLAEAPIADSMQGTIFLGNDQEPAPRYHFAFRERADERLDCVRMLRDDRYAFHINYMPYAPAGQHLAYLWKAPATPAWEKHFREGKTNDIQSRFFKPRVSHEFFDTQEDFDNVHNLIDAQAHASKIAELKAELRRRQLELYDSGLLPEKMRERRAAANNMTIYEMVRDKKLYPLSQYLDAADLALARDPANVGPFIEQLGNDDPGMRWWAVVGLRLLDNNAAAAEAALKKALQDEAHEICIMAAWTLVQNGETEASMACLEDLLFNGSNNETMLHNTLDWMGEPAFGLVKRYIETQGSRDGKYGIGILGRIAQLQGW